LVNYSNLNNDETLQIRVFWVARGYFPHPNFKLSIFYLPWAHQSALGGKIMHFDFERKICHVSVKKYVYFEVFPYLGVQLASNESFWHDWLVGEPQAGERCQLAVVVSGISHVLYNDIVVYVATFKKIEIIFFCEVLANIFRSCFEVIMQKIYVYNL
jgi:hypothetical protein